MHPGGSVIQRVSDEDTLQQADHHREFHPEVNGDKKTAFQKFPLIKKIFRVDGNSTLRRTSSFMLRTKTEKGGKYIMIKEYK